jgi:hypothetical protein
LRHLDLPLSSNLPVNSKHLRLRARKLVISAVSFVSAFSAYACDRATKSTTELGYDKRIAKWQHDSSVVDSLSRRINTDSVYFAYQRLLTEADLETAFEDIGCMRYRLRLRHGVEPATKALERMYDTLWLHADPKAVASADKRMEKILVVEGQDPDECNAGGIVPAPDSINGTSLVDIGNRP